MGMRGHVPAVCHTLQGRHHRHFRSKEKANADDDENHQIPAYGQAGQPQERHDKIENQTEKQGHTDAPEQSNSRAATFFSDGADREGPHQKAVILETIPKSGIWIFVGFVHLASVGRFRRRRPYDRRVCLPQPYQRYIRLKNEELPAMQMIDPKKIEEVFRRLAIEAGRAIMEIYDSGDLGVEAKSDDSPVTLADIAADKIIRAGLTEAFPDIQLVTEEMASSHGGEREELFFLVDPLDGTKEFVKRGGDFTVNIALIDNGVAVAGVVFAPAKARLFLTSGNGATEETGEFAVDVCGPTRPIKCAEPDNTALRVVASASHRDAATDEYIARYDVGAFKPAGSSMKFCLLAAGEADFYPRLGRTMEWDTAAGHAVLRAAGGDVVRHDDPTAPLRYGKPGDDNPFFIAFANGVTLR